MWIFRGYASSIFAKRAFKSYLSLQKTEELHLETYISYFKVVIGISPEASVIFRQPTENYLYVSHDAAITQGLKYCRIETHEVENAPDMRPSRTSPEKHLTNSNLEDASTNKRLWTQ